MKVLIIGGVAAGTKTAAKLKREDRNIEVTVITKDQDISYAGCGLPYYVGGLIEIFRPYRCGSAHGKRSHSAECG